MIPAVTTLAGQDEVARVAALARADGRLGLDTEFMSEGRYRALACVVQTAVVEGDDIRISLFDALADQDFTPLAEVLADPDIEIVLHAGRQDVAILRRTWRTDVHNLFDTQIAAGFAGQGAQTGYGNLLGAVLGVRVGKTASYTRWDQRPLTDEQLAYAREDVVHLLQLRDELAERLQATGRLEWAREECRRLEDSTDARDPEEAWLRLPRISALDPRSRAVARELAAWRERTAAAEDKPVGTIVQDVALVEVAKRRPKTVEALAGIRGLHGGVMKRRAQDMLAAIERGEQAEPIPRDQRRSFTEPGDAPLIALAEALIRARTLAAGLAYELVASRAELDQIVAAARRGDPEPDVRPLQGWRREVVGEDLEAILTGRRGLRVGAEGRLETIAAPAS